MTSMQSGAGSSGKWVPTWLLFAVLGCASLLFGGGGRGAALASGLVHLIALTVLLLAFVETKNFIRTGPRHVVLLALATLAVPILQLIPVPPAIWEPLPGRSLIADSYSLIDLAGRWRPFTVDVNLTLLALIGLAAPLAILMLGFGLDRRWMNRAVLGVLAFAVLNVLIGAVQLASDGDLLTFFSGGDANRMSGLFANHNTIGVFLVIALCLLVGVKLESVSPEMATIGKVVLAIVFFIGILATQSRSSMVLMLIPLGLSVVTFLRISQRRPTPKQSLVLLLGALLVIGGGIVGLQQNERVSESIERFGNLDSPRFETWEDSYTSASRFWPVGAGVGAYDEVIQVDESLEHVNESRYGRAHNDYLEAAVESGIFGLLIVFGWGVSALVALAAAWRTKSSQLPLSAAAGLAAIAAQSSFDFPLRNQAMLCVFALLMVILLRRDWSRK